jgi:hypothetical protein
VRRNAFFLEDEEKAVNRYGGKLVQKAGFRASFPPFTDASSASVDPFSLALSVLAQTMTGNPDWFLRMSPRDVETLPIWKTYNNWNVHIAMTAGKTVVPIVHDWDLSGWVRGPWTEFDYFGFALLRLAAYPKLTPLAIDQARHDFLEAREQIYRDVDAAFSDPAAIGDVSGRDNIRRHLDLFFAWISKPLTIGQ